MKQKDLDLEVTKKKKNHSGNSHFQEKDWQKQGDKY